MGAWGTDIFDNDSAADMKMFWARDLEKGIPPEQISSGIRWPEGSYKPLIEEPVLVYALVALQIEADALEDDLAAEAVQMIDEDYELEIWNDPDERRQKLIAFRERLHEYQARRVEERRDAGAAKPLVADDILY